jgi:hypothetical protein
MSLLLIRLGQLFLGLAAVTGPLVILVLILKARDRRESNLCGIILKQLNSPNLRGLFSFRVRQGLLLRRDVVILDLWGCSSEQIWRTTMQLSLSLAPEVRLVVNGTMDFKHKVGFAMKVRRGAYSVDPAFCCR